MSEERGGRLPLILTFPVSCVVPPGPVFTSVRRLEAPQVVRLPLRLDPEGALLRAPTAPGTGGGIRSGAPPVGDSGVTGSSVTGAGAGVSTTGAGVGD